MEFTICFKKLLLASIFVFSLISLSAHSEVNWNFSKAKKLAKSIYTGNETSFYCGCDYRTEAKKLVPDWNSCGYVPRNKFTKSGKINSRSIRIEWEHVMPAWLFGKDMNCWKTGGRKACKKNKDFEKMESDLHNLVPAVGEVNGDRSNFTFGNISGENRVYGKCDFEIDFKKRIVEPKETIRGDIARIYFYMSKTYKVPLAVELKQMLELWSASDPVDTWERKRDAKIQAIQGNSNTFLTLEGKPVIESENKSDTKKSKKVGVTGQQLKGVKGRSNTSSLSNF